jgi:hypothetical protein
MRKNKMGKSEKYKVSEFCGGGEMEPQGNEKFDTKRKRPIKLWKL